MTGTGRAACRLAAAVTLCMALIPGTTSAATDAHCAGLRVTITGTAGSDTIVGTRGRDVIAARSGWDTVHGRGGPDVICGADGVDRLNGGGGDDRLYGGRGGVIDDRSGRHLRHDTLRGGPGDDLLVGGRDSRNLPSAHPDLVDYSLAVRGMEIDLGRGTAYGQGRDRLSRQGWSVIGSDHDDRMVGGQWADHLDGGLGADHLEGRGSADVLIGDVTSAGGDRATDVLRGQGGDDVLLTWAGVDLQYGGRGDDELRDDGGSVDRLYGQGGDDWLTDTIVRGEDQVLSGGIGDNRLDLRTRFSRGGAHPPAAVMDLRTGRTTVESSPATVAETSAFTTVRLPDGPWTVFGTGAAEHFWESTLGPRTIYAGDGDDYLGGTRSADHLDGGNGYDSALPDGGRDTCVSIEAVVDGAACTTSP